MSKIFTDYVKEKKMDPSDMPPDIKSEYENQKKYLKNSVTSLKKKKNKDKELHEHSNLDVMNENLELIKEINLLISRKNKMKSSNIRRDQNNMKSNSVSKRSFSSKILT